MRRSEILENRRKNISEETRHQLEMSFKIVDRIYEILQQRGLRQKDLAALMNKSEAEISKWMRGTHNFTIDTLCSIESALNAPIIQVIKSETATSI